MNGKTLPRIFFALPARLGARLVLGPKGLGKGGLALLGALSLSLTGCGYNTLQSLDEDTKAAWSEVVNQYQRRADLVPNLVNTVKGYAAHERDVLTQVTEARSRIGSIQATPELVNDQAAMDRFVAAQGQLQGALSRLLALSENYPQLKADASFRDLQAQLEGTENRITVARNRYIESVRNFNVKVRQFPSNLTAKVFGLEPKANFAVENERAISTAPTVDFGTAPPPSGTAPSGQPGAPAPPGTPPAPQAPAPRGAPATPPAPAAPATPDTTRR